jgi:hypothetical protein
MDLPQTLNWDDKIEEWTAYGLLCRIKPGLMSLNGYVQIPRELFDRDTARRTLAVHGSANYGPDADGWVGFDTAHGGDHWAPDDLVGHLSDEALMFANELRRIATRSTWGRRRWTMKLLREETERLAQQIAVALDLASIEVEEG